MISFLLLFAPKCDRAVLLLPCGGYGKLVPGVVFRLESTPLISAAIVPCQYFLDVSCTARLGYRRSFGRGRRHRRRRRRKGMPTPPLLVSQWLEGGLRKTGKVSFSRNEYIGDSRAKTLDVTVGGFGVNQLVCDVSCMEQSVEVKENKTAATPAASAAAAAAATAASAAAALAVAAAVSYKSSVTRKTATVHARNTLVAKTLCNKVKPQA
jgi:hypothetical protein